MDVETPAMRRRAHCWFRIDWTTDVLGCGWSIHVGKAIPFSPETISAFKADQKEEEVCPIPSSSESTN